MLPGGIRGLEIAKPFVLSGFKNQPRSTPNFAFNKLLNMLLQTQSVEEVKIALDPILKHGRDNISYLYSMDTFDWVIISIYFSILLLLAITGLYRNRMIYHFWRYLKVKPQPKRRFAQDE